MQRKIRVLVGKPGLDGHDRGAKVVAAALRDAGMEVIYTGLHQTPEQIVEAAVQEDVDVVALSVLSGAHMTLFPEVLRLMQGRGIGDRLLTGGGIIPTEDMAGLEQQGVGRLFGPGTNTGDIVTYIREWYAGVHGAEALPPLPPPPARPAPLLTPLGRPTPRPALDRHHAAAAKPARKAARKRVAPTGKKTAPARRKSAKKRATSAASRGSARSAKKKSARPRAKAARRPTRKAARSKK
jgi:methylmalonyl-CoA mutase C-terminal domain/subunit